MWSMLQDVGNPILLCITIQNEKRKLEALTKHYVFLLRRAAGVWNPYGLVFCYYYSVCIFKDQSYYKFDILEIKH
jgi:hypothetical protein